MFPLANLYFELSEDYVPAPKIAEIIRLHNKIYTDYNFFDQLTTTIYSVTTPESGIKDILHIIINL